MCGVGGAETGTGAGEEGCVYSGPLDIDYLSPRLNTKLGLLLGFWGGEYGQGSEVEETGMCSCVVDVVSS